MDNFYPHIRHRKSIRLKGYDYSNPGLYFITICAYDRKCLFGKIENSRIKLNDAGNIAEHCWLDIPRHFPNSILHEHVVMPNHIHGIIELTVGVENFQPLQSQNRPSSCDDIENFQPLQSQNRSSSCDIENIQPLYNEFQKMIPHSISSIVKGFKIGVTKWFRNNKDSENVWQRNYYEHIIRDEKSYQRIKEYILNNPANWSEDDFFNT